MTARFGAVVTAMVTPFDEGGRLDLDGAATLARWLVDHGSDGLVVAGTTGEASVLSDAEKLDLWRAVRDAVEVPVLAGTGSNDTAHTVALTEQAAATGVNGALVVTPYYSRPGPAGIEAHFRAAAGASALPVVIYDIPVRTGRKVPTEVLWRLAEEVPTVVGVKDAAGDVAESARLVSGAPEGFELYCGDDALTLPLVAVGAAGVIGVATHWAARHFGRLIAAVGRGDLAGARALNAALLESYEFESGPEWPNPLPTKAMLRTLGLSVGKCRLPMGDAPPALEDRARQVHARLAATRDGQRDRDDRCLNRLESPSWGAWGRLDATAPASRSTGDCFSSTAGSCFPTPTCWASTWCCPTSTSCARTPTGSRESSPPMVTRTTWGPCRTCCGR